MKITRSTILPIALAFLLPLIGFYSNTELALMSSIKYFDFFEKWLFVSFMLYLLWYILWFLWEIKSAKRSKIIALIGLILLFFTMILVLINDFRPHYAIRLLFVFMLFLIIQYAMKAQENISRLLLEKEQMQTENYKIQLQALHAKVDPHFLFNSLNTLRAMVRQHHPQSEKFIISLSDFYRQTLKYDESSTLPLCEELAVWQSYLFLMKSRNEDAVSVSINTDSSYHSYHLPTLALQLATENCFKHNSMTSKYPLQISLHSTADGYIVLSNNIQPKIEPQEPSGYGLNLLRRRYELMNVSQGVIVEQTAEQFTVRLKLIQR